RDKIMIDVLKSIGIEKGKPFNPNNSRSRTGKQEAWRSEGTVVATRDQRGSSPWRILYQQLLCERDNAGRAVPLPVRSGRGGKPPPGRSFGESARHSGSSATGA